MSSRARLIQIIPMQFNFIFIYFVIIFIVFLFGFSKVFHFRNKAYLLLYGSAVNECFVHFSSISNFSIFSIIIFILLFKYIFSTVLMNIFWFFLLITGLRSSSEWVLRQFYFFMKSLVFDRLIEYEIIRIFSRI